MRQKILHAVLWSATRTGGQTFVTFLVFLALARLVDPKSFGLVAMATVFTEFILMFQDQGFDQAIVQREELDDTHLDTAFWVSLTTGGLLTCCGMAVAGPVGRLFGEPEVESIVRWLALCLLFVSIGSTQSAILRRSLKMRELAVRSLLATVISGGVAIVMAFKGFGVWSLVARSLVSTAVESTVVWLLSDWRPRLRFRWSQFVELFTFGASVVGKRLVTVVNRRCDALLIGLFLGPVLLGFYTVAYKLIFLTRNLMTSIPGPVALPAFSRMQQEPERLRSAFFEATRLTSVVAFPVFLGIAAISHELVPALYGKQWSQSVPIVQLLALVGILQSVFYYHSSLMVAAGKPSWSLAVKLASTVVSLIALLIAVRWGIVAVAAACLVSNLLAAPVSLLVVQRCVTFRMRSYLFQCAAPLVASLAMFAAVFGLRQMPLQAFTIYGQLAVMVVGGATVYVLALQIAAPSLTTQMVELVRSLRPNPNRT